MEKEEGGGRSNRLPVYKLIIFRKIGPKLAP